MDPNQLIDLLGRLMEDPIVLSFIESVSHEARWEYDEDASFCSIYSRGLELKFWQRSKVSSVFILSEGEDGAKGYKGPLPGGLKFSDSRAIVRSKLGAPQSSGGGRPFLNESVPTWDKYEREGYCLHIQYSLDENLIKRITLQQATSV